MTKTPHYDAKVKEILDKTTPGERVCALTGEKWMFDAREMEWCRQFNAPPSKYSPGTRMRLLLGHRSSFEIFWNKHALTNEPTLSYIHPNIPIPIVSDLEWHSQDVDTVPNYQASYDLSQPILSQLTSLVKKVPVGARRGWKNVVNTIGVGMWDVEDCYMVFSTVDSKRAMYTYYCLERSEDITQSVFVTFSHNCFSSTRIDRCHSCTVALESRDCIKCSFVFDCRNCEDCFGATNLRNKKYVFWNEQLSKEEYERRVGEINLSSRSAYDAVYERFTKLVEQSAFPATFSVNAPECDGEYLFDCVRTHDSFYMLSCTDCAYNYGSKGAERCVYVASAYPATDSWMCSQLWTAAQAKYCMNLGNCQDMEYCFNCVESEHCFGCVGLNRKKFYIFNKPFAEEEYWRRVDEIKCAMLDRGEYGEFFSQEVSPCGMQFSMASVLYDMSLDEARKLGAPIYDPDKGVVLAPKKTTEEPPVSLESMPDCIGDIDSAAWVGKPFLDAKVHRRWAVVPKEFEFYRSHHLPFPREHYSSRLRRQMQMMNIPVYEETSCAVCETKLRVAKNKTFTKRRVHCMKCYLAHLERNG